MVSKSSVENWVEHCSDSIEALTFVAGQWQRENEYCVITYKKNKNSKEKNIEEHEIEPLDFYPLKSDNSWMYQIIIGCKIQQDGMFCMVKFKRIVKENLFWL